MTLFWVDETVTHHSVLIRVTVNTVVGKGFIRCVRLRRIQMRRIRRMPLAPTTVLTLAPTLISDNRCH